MEKFYIDTGGNDDEAYREAMQFACEYAKNNANIRRVVLLALSKNNVDWLKRLYGERTVKDLFNGTTFNGCTPEYIIKTKRTYKDPMNTSDFVISMGLNSEDLMKVDDYYGIVGILAIPWTSDGLSDWIKTWGPIDIRSNEKADIFPLPDPITQAAMEELSSSINRTTGIHHPSDNKQAKTYIRALHKYLTTLDGNKVNAYLIRELNWKASHALEVKELIDTLNDGRYFQGGDKTGLKSHIKRWEANI